MNKLPILSSLQCEQKLNRMAHQMLENYYLHTNIVLAGISGNGFKLAEILKSKLQSISTLQIHLLELVINKENPLTASAKFNLPEDLLNNNAVIVVDDVLNSGKTLIYGVKAFLDYPVKSIHTAVLVDRSHKNYPVTADFVGLSLSTTLQDHIRVEVEGTSVQAFLD